MKSEKDKTPAANSIFIPSDIDDALHETTGIIYEWWYLDAAFNNGYSMSAAWQIVDPVFINDDEVNTRLVMFAIYDPSGKKTSVDAPYSANDVTASKTSCDVTMGTNHLKGDISRYDMQFRDKGLGCDLIFESVTEAFRIPPDGVEYFTRQPDKWIGWVVALPRARVTGKLILDGKEIPVTGEGYHDHNWGNVSLKEMYSYWYWGRIYLPDYTFIYSVGKMTDALGAKPISVLLAYKGDKLVDITTNITAEGSEFVPDQLTGAEYPRTLVLRPEGSAVRGTITHKLNHLLEGLSPWGAKDGGGRGYFRFLSDCDIKLDVTGDKIDIKTPLIHEYMRP